ncbi:hypothetical protein ONZ51_g8856 [Trametes cubensis]|uniref:Uncharacterized protein n=1 Tax=Trametes cubensis TaxID=1111947 RepID=A0AAD7X7U1_9APHY|nr:hypothetical protein ONZ51_g8856 [Trametes cubensis]
MLFSSLTRLRLATITVLLVVTSVFAANAPRAVSPTIISPSSQDSWSLGSVQTVTWLTDGFNVTGVNGTVLMGYVETNGTVFLYKGAHSNTRNKRDDWLMMYLCTAMIYRDSDQPLAENFPLADGVVNVRCPLNLPSARRYVVALLGDDNNISAVFSVRDDNDPQPSVVQNPPATLSTQGNVPSATITHTSVVGTIPPASKTSSSSGSGGASASTTSGSPQETNTDTKHNGAHRLTGHGGAMFAIVAGPLLSAAVTVLVLPL